MKLVTDNKVALESLEYLYPLPHRNIQDKSTSLEFISRCQGMGNLLDLGCGGGKFVADCIASGIEAVGVDGSPYYAIREWSEWPNPNLFLCDVTKPFKFDTDFDIITAWELLEHIPEKDLEGVFKNVEDNLKPFGMFVVSISNKKCLSPDEKVDYHVTKKDKEWWIKRFEKHGFVRKEDLEEYFEGSWVRKEKGGFQLIWTI